MNIFPFLLSAFFIAASPFCFKLYEYPELIKQREERKKKEAENSANSLKPTLTKAEKINLENEKDKLLSLISVKDCVVKVQSSDSNTFKNLIVYDKVGDLESIEKHFFHNTFIPKCFIASKITRGFLGFTKNGDEWSMDIFVSKKDSPDTPTLNTATKKYVIVPSINII